MGRGLYAGGVRVAAIGYAGVTYPPTFRSLSYPSLAAFESEWTKHVSSGFAINSSIGANGPFPSADGHMEFSWNGGGTDPGDVADAYYEGTITGLTPLTLYDVAAVVTKASGYDLRAVDVVAFGGEGAGGGVPNNQPTTLQRRVLSDALGQIDVQLGMFRQGFVHNGFTTVEPITVTPLEGVAAAGLLTFYWDAALAWPMPREGWTHTQSDAALRHTTVLRGVDRILKGTVRRIPAVGGVQDDGHTISGWDDWQTFLANALDCRPLTFYPDASDLGVSVTPCYLQAPIGERPQKDGIRRWMLDLELRSPSTAFVGY